MDDYILYSRKEDSQEVGVPFLHSHSQHMMFLCILATKYAYFAIEDSF